MGNDQNDPSTKTAHADIQKLPKPSTARSKTAHSYIQNSPCGCPKRLTEFQNVSCWLYQLAVLLRFILLTEKQKKADIDLCCYVSNSLTCHLTCTSQTSAAMISSDSWRCTIFVLIDHSLMYCEIWFSLCCRRNLTYLTVCRCSCDLLVIVLLWSLCHHHVHLSDSHINCFSDININNFILKEWYTVNGLWL